MTVFCNSSGRTTIRSAFNQYASGVHRIALAAPFFSYSGILEELDTSTRTINLLVRLGPATSADALRKVFTLPNVSIRYFTSPYFHSKVYIFGDNCALIGSANLTSTGMQSNREVVVTVFRDSPDFDDIVSIFESYWSEADVLDEPRLTRYCELWSRARPLKSADTEFEDQVRASFGDILPSNGIQVGKPRPSAEKLYLEDYRRTYQGFLAAFREVEMVYNNDGRRQQPELPLRIEIDQFFSYIRKKHGSGDSYLEAPLRSGVSRTNFINELIHAWFNQRWLWLDNHIIEVYPQIVSRLGTPQAIKEATMEEILDALEVCHAFNELLRFHLGGKPTLRKEFAESNELSKIKTTITFLLHGKEPFVDRMGIVIFDPSFKLAKFGRSVVQELLGWVNHEDVPVCNGRTIKALRYLGFDLKE